MIKLTEFVGFLAMLPCIRVSLLTSSGLGLNPTALLRAKRIAVAIARLHTHVGLHVRSRYNIRRRCYGDRLIVVRDTPVVA